MKTKNILAKTFLISCILMLTFSCTKPMDTPVKASSIQEYASSVLKIYKKLSNQEQEEFDDALTVVAVSREVALSVVYFPTSSKATKVVTEAVKSVDGKTPHEIISKANRIMDRLKKELLDEGKQIEGKTIQEILKIAREENIPYWEWN